MCNQHGIYLRGNISTWFYSALDFELTKREVYQRLDWGLTVTETLKIATA